MAKEVNGIVSGSLGPVVHYSYNGKSYIRARRRAMKKTGMNARTMHLAELFGTLSPRNWEFGIEQLYTASN
jgi:hypothetical protein